MDRYRAAEGQHHDEIHCKAAGDESGLSRGEDGLFCKNVQKDPDSARGKTKMVGFKQTPKLLTRQTRMTSVAEVVWLW